MANNITDDMTDDLANDSADDITDEIVTENDSTVTFIEEDAVPVEFIDAIPGDVILSAYEQEPYYLTMQTDGEYRGIAVFNISPDHLGASLSYIYVASGFRGEGIGGALLREAVGRLRTAGVEFINLFLYGDNIEETGGFFKKYSFEKAYERGMILSYDKQALQDHVLRYSRPEFTGELLSDLREIDEISASVANILREMRVPFMCHEGSKGYGKYLLDDEEALIGVLLGGRDIKGDLCLSFYMDSGEENSPAIFLALLDAQIRDFVISGGEESRFRVYCINDMMRDISESCLGVTEDMEWVMEYRIDI